MKRIAVWSVVVFPIPSYKPEISRIIANNYVVTYRKNNTVMNVEALACLVLVFLFMFIHKYEVGPPNIDNIRFS